MQFREDRIGDGGPLERLRMGVVVGDELIDALHELLDARERAAPNSLPGPSRPRSAVSEAQELTLPAYSVEKLYFEDATTASGPLERSRLSAHGGVLATHQLSPASRYEARSVARDPNLSTAQRSRRIPRPSEIEFFNRIG